MEQLAGPQATLSEKFDRVKQAGFDGMTIDLGALSLQEARATVLSSNAPVCGAGLRHFRNPLRNCGLHSRSPRKFQRPSWW